MFIRLLHVHKCLILWHFTLVQPHHHIADGTALYETVYIFMPTSEAEKPCLVNNEGNLHLTICSAALLNSLSRVGQENVCVGFILSLAKVKMSMRTCTRLLLYCVIQRLIRLPSLSLHGRGVAQFDSEKNYNEKNLQPVTCFGRSSNLLKL